VGVLVSDFEAEADVADSFAEGLLKAGRAKQVATEGVGNIYALRFAPWTEHSFEGRVKIDSGLSHATAKHYLQFAVTGEQATNDHSLFREVLKGWHYGCHGKVRQKAQTKKRSAGKKSSGAC
jgi:hypothetical protein